MQRPSLRAACKTVLHFHGRSTSYPIMMDIDLNFWGLAVVPVGVSICFFPALFIWICQELKAGRAEKESAKGPSN
jgi:hypothetical protein